MIIKILLSILLLVFVADAYQFKNGLDELNLGNIKKARDIFCNINEHSIFYEYADYYCTVLSAVDGNIKISEKKPKLAVEHYKFFFISKFYLNKNPKISYKFFKKIDKKALHKDDLPEYFFLKYKLEGTISSLKKLIIDYAFDDIYAFPLLDENLKKLSEKDIYKAIDKMISHRKFDNALKILEKLKDTDKKFFYKTSLLLKKRKYSDAENTFYLIKKSSKYYPIGLYKLTIGLKNIKKQKYYFSKLEKTSNQRLIAKARYILMKKSFFKEKWDYFKFFSKDISKNSPYYKEKIWLEILYKYKTKDYIGAYLLLQDNKNLFSKSKVNYWLYLISKKAKLKNSLQFLKLASATKSLDFYTLYAKKRLLKLDVQKVSFSLKHKQPSDKRLKLIKNLKDLKLYKWAYIEGKYILKKESDINSIIKLYYALPELTAKKLALKGFTYESFPKPFKIPVYAKFQNFEELVFAVMRQESFFDYYAVSPSNAIGLMQIIPPTAKWIAKVRNKDLTNINLLFNPEVNIDFGSWYLGYLLKMFNNNIFYAVSSYNAGQGAVKKFLKGKNFTDIAEFIEFFPYEETRNYVKKVVRNYFIYKYLVK